MKSDKKENKEKKIDLCNLDLIELENFLNINIISEKKFRAKQIFEWVNKKNIRDLDSMTNISQDLRQKLKNKFYLNQINIVKKIDCDDLTSKFLLKLDDLNIVESVLIKYSYGNTICVSSQVGCKMGCKFCASTVNGFIRNLSTAEMCWQVYLINKIKKISNIVIMGSGEPLDNYSNVIKFIKIISSKDSFNISQRHITLSTCGLVDRIYSLAHENLKINLAVSLHAPNDYIRQKIMPIANKYKISDIIKACKFYFENTGRRITFEYLLAEHLNDNIDNAYELSELLKNFACHVNIIRLNKIKNSDLNPSSLARQNKFISILKSFNINTTIRRRLGDNINAACGQLRNSFLSDSQNLFA